MSATKTTGPTIVAVAIAMVIAIAVLPSVRGPRVDNDDDDESVVVTVTFKPERRTGDRPADRSLSDVVVIEIEMAPDVQQKELTRQSPWIGGYRLRPGQRIWVRANQAYGSEITCKIEADGRQVAYDRNFGAQDVSCIYTRAR